MGYSTSAPMAQPMLTLLPPPRLFPNHSSSSPARRKPLKPPPPMAALPPLRRFLAFRGHRRLLSTTTTTTTTPAASSSNPPTPEAVLYDIHSLSKDPSQALAVFRRSAAAGQPVSPAAYNLMLRTLASHPSSAQRHFWPFLREMQEAGHSVDQGTYLAALASFKKASLTADYASLTAHYVKFRKGAKSATASAVAEAVRDHDAAGLDSRLDDIGLLPLTETAVTTVLRELREHPVKALAFFRWAGRQQGYTHSSVVYNAMARVLGREESVPEFWDLIREMKAAGMHVDIDTYLKLSRNFQKRHMVREAVELYELMMDGPFKPAQLDGPLIIRRISLGPSPDLELVNRVVNKFEAVWGVKTKELLDGVHRALTSNGMFDEAAEIVRTMRDQGQQPDNVTYSQLVYGLCKANKLEDARKVLDEMEAEGCAPDLKTWTVLIHGYCLAGDVDRVVQSLTEMIDKGLDADADLLDVILKGLCSHEKVEEAYSLFVEMVDKAELRPLQVTCQRLIGELLRVNKLEEALALLKTMKTCKFPPFADPFPPYIAKYGTVEDARNFFKALTANTSPTPAAYLHVLKLFFAEGRYSEAQELLYKCPNHIRKHPHVTELFESIKVESSTAS